MAVSKQVGDVYFDQIEGVFRASVEFYTGTEMFDEIATIPVQFAGSKKMSFEDIEREAFNAASATVKALIDA